jgi:hypothetical protein
MLAHFSNGISSASIVYGDIRNCDRITCYYKNCIQYSTLTLNPSVSTMNEGRVKQLNGGSGGVDLLLQCLHRPVWLLPHWKYGRELAYFIFNWSKFGVVLWTSDNAESAGTITACHGLVHICQVMSRQVVPNKNAMVVCPLDPKLLNLRANVIAEITENVGCCPTALHTPNPTPMTLHTSEDMLGGGLDPPARLQI